MMENEGTLKRELFQQFGQAFQLDWRWVRRYRELSAYDAYWWWAHAGPFTVAEQESWDQLFVSPVDEGAKDQLRLLLLHSRDRELETALAEHREPHLHYPAIEVDLVRQRTSDFLALDAEVNKNEPHTICDVFNMALTLVPGLLSDEVTTLSVMGRYNVFGSCDDSGLRETIPAHW